MIPGTTRFSAGTEAACTRLRLLIHPGSSNRGVGRHIRHGGEIIVQECVSATTIVSWSRLRGSAAIRFRLQVAVQARFMSK